MSWQVRIPHILPGQGYSVVTGNPSGMDDCFHPSITTPRRKTQNVPATEKFLKYFLRQKIPADFSAEITKSHLISFRKPSGYVL